LALMRSQTFLLFLRFINIVGISNLKFERA